MPPALTWGMSESQELRATVVVGNPKAGSRTREVGVAVAAAVLDLAGVPASAVEVIELSELAGALFAWGDPAVQAAKATVLASDLLVVASPVYKASYTGLLKAFLDQFGQDELRAMATVPVMVGAAAPHSLAVESQLRPVLVEIGASCPTRGLYVLEADARQPGAYLPRWLDVWGAVALGVVLAHTQRRETVA
jgi:FMN reductase